MSDNNEIMTILHAMIHYKNIAELKKLIGELEEEIHFIENPMRRQNACYFERQTGDVWDYEATNTFQNNLEYDAVTGDWYEKPRKNLSPSQN